MPPQVAQADRQALLALYQHQSGWVQAKADGNAILVTAGVAVIAVLLVLLLRKPPAAPTPAPADREANPAPGPRSTAGSPAPE